jgi:hypothetical protein
MCVAVVAPELVSMPSDNVPPSVPWFHPTQKPPLRAHHIYLVKVVIENVCAHE